MVFKRRVFKQPEPQTEELEVRWRLKLGWNFILPYEDKEMQQRLHHQLVDIEHSIVEYVDSLVNKITEDLRNAPTD